MEALADCLTMGVGRRNCDCVVAEVAIATTSSNNDAVKTILKVKEWGAEVGGLEKLKALVDALSE